MSKLRPLEGSYDAADARIAIVVSRWNSEITENLLQGALTTLGRHAIADDQVQVVRVPGAFELPLASQKIAANGNADAIVALGCVIRGDTPHFDYVCTECTRGLGRVGLDFGLPVGFGLLTCDTLAQAQARSGENSENKGEEAVLTVLEMVSLLKQLG